MCKRNNVYILIILTTIIYGINSEITCAQAMDPDMAPVVTIDRFSNEAGVLHTRESNMSLPGPNEAINFDKLFLFQGFGPSGEVVQYYDFDVMPAKAAPIYVLFREGQSTPVEGQLNIIDVIPGDDHYNDFWHVHKVIVPSEYDANTVTSLSEITEHGFTIKPTSMLVNCPVVPKGSKAEKRYTSEEEKGLIRGWYRNQVVFYFSFEEKALSITSNGMVPTSPIYVSFNINPGEEGGGPSSGFKTEEGNAQTHNILASIPDDDYYSPLWFVSVYNNANFESVTNLMTLSEAKILAGGVAIVNCPVVNVSSNEM